MLYQATNFNADIQKLLKKEMVPRTTPLGANARVEIGVECPFIVKTISGVVEGFSGMFHNFTEQSTIKVYDEEGK